MVIALNLSKETPFSLLTSSIYFYNYVNEPRFWNNRTSPRREAIFSEGSSLGKKKTKKDSKTQQNLLCQDTNTV